MGTVADYVEIDGSEGEGGGQILRTSLGLSLLTGKAFRIDNIRAGREKPGLLRQHLTAVQAAAAIGAAEVAGDAVGSRSLVFRPRAATPGQYHFAVGTAGSATLVLQTVLPALLAAPVGSAIALEGGTHNPAAPPFDFLAKAFLPLLERMGPRVTATLERPGFYPAGGGRLVARIEPAKALAPLELVERGDVKAIRARALVSRIPEQVGAREVTAFEKALEAKRIEAEVVTVTDSPGPGNALVVEVECEHVTEVFTGFGQRGVRAEAVAAGVAEEVRPYLQSGVPVGSHLADQLLIPLAMAGEGRFRTLEPTLHTLTNLEVIRRFLDVSIDIRQDGPSYTITIQRMINR